MNIPQLISRLVKHQDFLSEGVLKDVCKRVKGILLEENAVAPVRAPVVIAGDIHGQFFDLLELFRKSGDADVERLTKRYVFLGDFVDRGFNSVETFQLLLLLKLRFPTQITLLRGNHESRQITQVYGFYDECVRKYGNSNPWRYCTEIFDYLCIAAVVDQSVFCVHGGLSPDVKLVDQIRSIQRVSEIPHEGPFGDLVWSDPEENVEGWHRNPRGAGWLFGAVPAREFNHLNGLDLIARAHQLVQEGFKYMFDHRVLDHTRGAHSSGSRSALNSSGGGAFGLTQSRKSLADGVAEWEDHRNGNGTKNPFQAAPRDPFDGPQGPPWGGEDLFESDAALFGGGAGEAASDDGVHFDLVTVWSAPNYCYRCGNVASVLLVDERKNRRFEIFQEVEASSKATPPRNLVPYFL